MRWRAVAGLAALAAVAWAQPEGSLLLSDGWRLRSAGRQVSLGALPMAAALSPDGKHLLVLNGGYPPPWISVLETGSLKEIGRAPVPDAWLGMAFTPNGRLVYVGGGSQASVFEFTFSPEGRLEFSRRFEVVPEAERTHRDFVGDVALTPDGRLIYAADLFHDRVLVINPQSGRVIERFPTGRRPYRILFHPDGKSYFVTSWADGTLHHHEVDNGREMTKLRLGPQPMDMAWREKQTRLEEGDEWPWKARLFIAAANTNRVYVVGVSESKELRQVETIHVAMTPMQPLGMTPSAVALSEDEDRLYVVCSDVNAVAVADVTEKRSRVLGFVPVGRYPTAARTLKDGRLVVLNGRGVGSAAARGALERVEMGSASLIERFGEEQLEKHTETVLENVPFEDRSLEHAAIPQGHPVPSRPGLRTPIVHVLYIVKGGRTYDELLGDLGKGNGRASLARFGGQVAPNHHKLASEFVLLDDFHVNSEVDADGQNWATAAISPAYVELMRPNSYAGRRRHYDYEGQEPAAVPPAGYLWTNAAAAGLSMRNYGHFVTNREKPASDGAQVENVRDPVLARVTNLYYRGFDLDYPDVERARVFVIDLAQMEASGEMPRLLLMRLANDVTSGMAPGKIAPRSAVADNDYALGLIVEACTRSRFWPKMAIFVAQAHTQGGRDHAGRHRAPAFVISPYAGRGAVDSRMYNTTSMLRTIELILGLHPMTIFDAGAQPMRAAFQAVPETKPYTAEKPRMSLEERNPPAGSSF